MKELLGKVISSTSDWSSKRLLLIFFSIILGFACVWAVVMGDWVFVISSLIALIITLAGINSGENRKKMDIENPAP